ncbi:F-box/kelch-repeat protein [Trifolium repens]|nr:F-box/kelch-repeat protein [Trifolium repens]
MMRKHIQHTKSCIRSRSFGANACGSRKEEDEDEEKTFGYCFSPCYTEVKEWFSTWNWKRHYNSKKCFEDLPIIMNPNPKKYVEVNYLEIFLLPDDILEMCLNRLPHTSLKNARLVCKKWSSLIIERGLLQISKKAKYKNLWLFVFGTIKHTDWSSTHAFNVNKIYALDLSRNKWHVIDADFLKGRFMFSVVGIRDGIFIVGGRSNIKNSKVKKTHKEVMFFNPDTESCHKLQSMKYARCDPILGVTEHSIIPYIRQRRSGDSNSSSKDIKRSFLLIALGGIDDDKLMYCGEMYDSLTNKWTQIQRLPLDFGSPNSGNVCGKMFYVISKIHKLAAYDIERGFWFAIETSSFPPKPRIEPKLVSSNGRLYMVSNYLPKNRLGIQSLVTTLWELDLMELTWTEISTDSDVNVDWRSANFVANRNLIFGVDKFESPKFEILDYFSIYDVSQSNTVEWSNISTNFIVHRFDNKPFWTRCMVVIHVNI